MNAGEAYTLFGKDPVILGVPFPFHLQLLVIVFVSLIAWVGVTYLTRPEPEQTLRAFYTRIQPGGWWSTIGQSVPKTMQPVSRDFLGNFAAGLAFVWGGMFCIGYACFQNWLWAGVMLVIMVAGFAWMWIHCLSKLDESP